MKPSLKLLDYSILQQCMHCGMCLPACPTYVATNKERHSPRGRISLMRAVADGELKLSPAFADEMSYCLGCLACQTACPAGVDYSNLLETARAEVQSAGLNQTFTSRFWRMVTIRGLFMRPRLLRFVGRLLWLYQRTMLGEIRHEANRGLADLSLREWATVLPLLGLALAIGIYPAPYFAVLERPVLELVGRLAR